MAIGPGDSWERPRLTGSTGRVLPASGQKFALHLKQAGFDRAGATKSPQQACQSMNERSSITDRGSTLAMTGRSNAR